jgi:predicted amidohydrolase YtcJ
MVTEPSHHDLLVVSERVMAMARPNAAPVRGGVAVRDGRIAEIVGFDQVEAARGPKTRVLDVGERPVLPGFIDVHAHVEVACRSSWSTVDCRAPECGCVADVQARLAERVAQTRPGEWIVAQANLFFDRKLAEGRLPTRDELDHVSRRHPIAIRAGGHITVLNTMALALAGIDRDFTPPSHSITGKPAVMHDHCGCPTGVVKEMDNILPLPTQEADAIEEALRGGIRELFTTNGVTTIGEISETVTGIGCMDRLARSDDLGARIRVYLWAPGTLDLREGCEWRDHLSLTADPDRLRVQGIKLFADGGYSAASAAVKSPYVHIDGESRGDIALTEADIEEALGRTRDADLQLAFHANGDRAQEWLCEMIERHDIATGGLRPRIEHAGNFRPDQETSEWWQRAGIIPVPQPVFLYTFGDYFVDYLGAYGARGRFPLRSLLEQGWSLSGSSDVWVGSEPEATRPMFGVWCCVKRESYAGVVIDPDEALTVDQALRMHTIDAAAVMGEADTKGSIEPGKLADLVVLDRDPFAVSVDDLRTIAVDYTILGGEIAYDRVAER